MISHLQVGMRVMLPSGNVIVLRRRERSNWVCEYHAMARQRGEVEFSGLWLRRWARQI